MDKSFHITTISNDSPVVIKKRRVVMNLIKPKKNKILMKICEN